jgi:hypothetical protein
MRGIDFDLDDYIADRPFCEVWPLMPMRIRHEMYQETHRESPHPRNQRVLANELAHICRGPGRRHYMSNVLFLNGYVHRWCDGHGAAGQVLMMLAKCRLGEADVSLWGQLMAGCNSVLGWVDSDKVREQCDRCGLEAERRALREIMEVQHEASR